MIDWNNAPDWANYAAMDASGSWWWYPARPTHASDGMPAWTAVGYDRVQRIKPVPERSDPWEDSLEARSCAGKPDWASAPSWARYLAQDPDGWWRWYERKPSLWLVSPSGGSCKSSHRSDPPADVAATLEPRPVPPPWDKAPSWAQWLAQDVNGTWHWFSNRPERGARGWWTTQGKILAAYVATGWADSLKERP